MLTMPEKKLYQEYLDSPNTFSTISTKDPGAKRAAKIVNFQQGKELKKKLEVDQILPSTHNYSC